MRSLILILAFLAGMQSALAADRGREQRWADEILPAVLEGDPVWLAQADGHKFLGLYLAPAKAAGAVILVHGMGVHPDFGVIGALRTRLAEMGYATLSIQMPVQGREAGPGDYTETFPEASERIAKAAAWLQAKGYGRIALVSHSLGGRMARAHFLASKSAPIKAWAALSMGFDDYKGVPLPVLDVYAEVDHPPVMMMTTTRKQTQAHALSEQRQLAATNHFYEGKEAEAAALVRDWLGRVLK
jgi:alpha/beta superfamily hydrolase